MRPLSDAERGHGAHRLQRGHRGGGGAGLALTPGALLSPPSGCLSDRIGAKLPILVGLAAMGLSILFFSAFGAGASPVMVSLGMPGSGMGFALANPPTANALPGEGVGAGLGIFQGAFFLGALNPLYDLDAAPFSDAFLLVTFALVLALISVVCC